MPHHCQIILSGLNSRIGLSKMWPVILFTIQIILLVLGRFIKLKNWSIILEATNASITLILVILGT